MDGGKAPVKIGIGWWVQVPYGEGVASHTGPEFCGGGSNNALNGGVVLKPSVPTHKLKVGSLLPLLIIPI